MSAINELIESLKGHITFCVKHRYGTSVLVELASQNVYITRFEIAKHYITLVEGEVNFLNMSANEIMEKGEQYSQRLYFSHQIHVDLIQKPWPSITGNYLCIDVAKYNKIYLDLDLCQEGQMALANYQVENTL